jgi:hypothetical protein
VHARAALLIAAVAMVGCEVPAQMTAAPDDLRDYRAFRTAAHEGRRLAAAQRYLARHPHGAWADEVRAAFDAEEAAWFERAATSRSRAREYVVDLPNGPHADAARAVLLLFDEHQGDIETLVLLADARRTAAMLDLESARRRRVSEGLLAEVSALLQPATWGARLDDLPGPLAAALRGEVPATWGAAPRASHTDRLYFVLPTPDGAQARALESTLALVTTQGRVVQGTIQGEDLFVSWSEAVLTRVLDPNRAADRAIARATIADLLEGALEATLPAARCAGHAGPGEIVTRTCDGWAVSARMGAEAGELDVIDVVGRPPPAVRARGAGMR